MAFKYKSRLIDDEIEEYLEMIGAILIEGPKWCGKTTTAEQHAKVVLNYRTQTNLKTI